MTETPELSLHPRLRRLGNAQHRRLRLLGLLLFLTMAGTVLYAMAIAMTSREAANLLLLALMGLVMLPIAGLCGGLLWWLDRSLERSLQRANALLHECEPVTMTLAPLRAAGRQGALVALRWPEPVAGHPLAGAATGDVMPQALLNPTIRWSTPPVQEVQVDLYCRALAAEGELVALPASGDPWLGKVVDPVAYQQRQRRLQGLALGLLILVLALAVLASRF